MTWTKREEIKWKRGRQSKDRKKKEMNEDE
jgi:hypothetical protein